MGLAQRWTWRPPAVACLGLHGAPRSSCLLALQDWFQGLGSGAEVGLSVATQGSLWIPVLEAVLGKALALEPLHWVSQATGWVGQDAAGLDGQPV